ncbi:MAG: hypothetical protein AAGC43_18115 [Bacteroidota bacterium]
MGCQYVEEVWPRPFFFAAATAAAAVQDREEPRMRFDEERRKKSKIWRRELQEKIAEERNGK